MRIEVEYKDTNGIITNQFHNLTRLAFAKHFAIAGQGYAPRPQKLIRTIAMFLHYSNYIQQQAFNNDRFSEPPIQLSDPTEKGQFSNLAGKAIADFLSKCIDHSIFTVNYEAAMRLRDMPLKVRRPDLLAFKQNAMFALEAKGYSGGHGNMTSHKLQSQTGGIPVNYSVTCVSYNLYKRVQCKYYDPFNDNIQFDHELLRELTRSYYKGLLGFLNQEFFEYKEFEFQDERFYEVRFSYKNLVRHFSNKSLFKPILYYKILDFYQPRLILPHKIRDYAEEGLTTETMPFEFNTNIPDDSIFIDNDRIGLRIGQY